MQYTFVSATFLPILISKPIGNRSKICQRNAACCHRAAHTSASMRGVDCFCAVINDLHRPGGQRLRLLTPDVLAHHVPLALC